MPLGDYRGALRFQQRELARQLGSMDAAAEVVAITRAAADEMERQLSRNPELVASTYDRLHGASLGAIAWSREILQLVARRWIPKQVDPHRVEEKWVEYRRLAASLRNRYTRHQLIRDSHNGIDYLISENETVREIVGQIETELFAWFESNYTREQFFERSARWGLATMLAERTDLVAALRAAQAYPNVESFDIPVERPAYVEVAELAIGLIPVVGNAVAAYEAHTGRDLFGYRLTATERAILGAAVLLPVVGRLLKGGRAMYTASRMTRLYGRDAATWTRAMGAGQRLSHNPAAVRDLVAAEEAIRSGRQVAADVAERLGEAFRAARLNARTTAELNLNLSAAVREAFNRLSTRHTILAELDELALDRIVQLGPSVDHMKGQLLEELLEARIVRWLRDPAGKAALGLDEAAGEIHFVPGHLIRDANGVQVTDGIVYRLNQDVMEILAVFECKAGAATSRDLRTTSGGSATAALRRTGRYGLSDTERADLLGFARDVLRDLQDQARLAGTTVDKTLDDVLAEITLTERGGQIARDFERLGASAGDEGDDLARLVVAGVQTEVRISRRWTKFFGVLPSGVRIGRMQQDLRALGYRFEIMGMPISARTLQAIAADLAPLVPP